MAVGEEGKRGGAGVGVKTFAEAQVGAFVVELAFGTFVAGPAGVVGVFGRRVEAIDLLEVVPADVADVDLVRRRVDREAEGVAQTEGDDPPRVGVGA